MQDEQLPQLPICPASEAQQLQQYTQSSSGQTQQLLGSLNSAYSTPFGHMHDAEIPISQESVHMPVQVQPTSQPQHHPTAHNGKENVLHDEWRLLLVYWSRTVNHWVDKKLEKCRLGQLEQGFHISLAAISFMHHRADPTQSEEFFEKLERLRVEGGMATVPQNHRHQASALNASAATFTVTPKKTKKDEDTTLVLKSQDKDFVATAPASKPALQRQTQDAPLKQTTQAMQLKSEVEPSYRSSIPSCAMKEPLRNRKYLSRVDSGQLSPPPQAAATLQDMSYKPHTANKVPEDHDPQPETPPLKTYPKPADLQGKLRLALESSDSFYHLQKMWFQRNRGQDSKEDYATRSPDGNDEVAE
ncbi:hypothetical protein CFE70_010283 [Pyrenophora teres f. teres 0-1]|uniref:Uncharacterized protein n=1 Tax=Pyrenophora teres f. teres (strain 0-1) TaxID=861557 RepID=E3S3A1_PYRTT|nr:hypothetical protein PTT_16922 [Pyrenophora teres f. teres 0-1]